MRKAIMVGTLAAGLLAVGTPLAHADSNDVAYTNQMMASGVPGTPDEFVNNGHKLCDGLGNHDVVSLAQYTSTQISLTVPQAGYEIGAAIRWLCPQQSWQVKELINGADPRVPGVTNAIAGYLGK